MALSPSPPGLQSWGIFIVLGINLAEKYRVKSPRSGQIIRVHSVTICELCDFISF